MLIFKFISVSLLISMYQCRVPDKVYCVNEKCSDPISKARTLLSYTSADPDLISFRGNAEAVVYMKSAGSNPDLWYATINGKTGFVNSQFLREHKVIQKTAQLRVFPLEYRRNTQPDLQPNKVQQAHEVIEGTTIFTTESGDATTQAESFTEPPAPSNSDNVTPSLSDSVQETPNSDKIEENVAREESNASGELNENIPSNLPSEPQETTQLQNDESSVSSTEASVQNPPENEVPQESNSEKEPQEPQPPQVPNEEPSPTEVSETIANGEDSSSQNVEATEKQDVQEEIKSGNENIAEQNTPNPTDTATEINQLAPETTTETKTVPETSETTINNVIVANPDLPEVIETKDENSLFGSFFGQENTDNLNGVSSTPSPVVEETPSTTKTDNVNTVQTTPPPLQQETPPSPAVIPPSFPDMANNIYNYPPILAPPSEVNEIPTNNNNINSQSASVPESSVYTYTTQSPVEKPSTNIINSYTTSEPDVSTEIPYSEPAVNIADNPSQSQSSSEHTEEASEPPPPDYSTMSTDALIDDIFTSTTESPTPAQENGEGILSNIYTTISDLWPSSTEAPATESLFNTEYSSVSEKKVDEGFSFVNFIMSGIMGSKPESHAVFMSGGESCFSEDYCDGTSNTGNRLLTFLLTTATSVLLFTLGYYYIDNKRQDGKLIGTINSLQRDLLFTSKECEILKEELATTKSKLAGIEDSSFGKDDMVQSLREEIDELKAQNERLRRSLDDNEKLLRVSENTAGELQNTLGEVENTLSELLGERANSEEQIAELNGKVQAFEEELISVSRERDNYQLKYVSAETALEEAKKQNVKLEELTQKLSESNNTIELQKHEITALKEALKDVKNGLSPNMDVSSLIDHTEIKAKLAKALEEKQSFEKKFEVEYKERKRLSDELSVTQESLQTTSQQATEALTRLEVLGKYFQERETELMKELSTKESLWLSKQGESASTVEKIELLQQEVQRHKEKCERCILGNTRTASRSARAT
ncbi:transport and Golgi organization protein 1-like [Ostrinia furnacalis]|uniref:transport and Golgi organization protein 1-like n=1 Tax=Ostrinia furnacalis TaxID=93504 RepID=UPI001039340A|nr:transport and Golgi organization protein 1-like [Ostrinia furnacalis]